MVPLTRAQVTVDAIGDTARLQMFECCGHGPHRDDPKGAEKVMRHFLADYC